jgi:polyferredoxin
VFITIGLGWRYPLLGFAVPVVMLMGVIGGIFDGRYVCGNLCPRGAFFDRVLVIASPRKGIPEWLRRMPFRWVILGFLFVFMVYRILQKPGDIYHWGRVFWLMCIITTGLGVILGLLVHQRMWCAFCPIGTIQSALGGRKNQLRIDPVKCIECELCEKKCPFDISIVKHKEEGVVDEPDCLKCSECIVVCPKKALSWQDTGKK